MAFFFFFVVFIVLQYCWGSPENKQYMGWPFIFLKSAWFFCSVLLYNLKLLDILKVKVLVAHSCPTLCDPMDYSPPGSSVYGNSPGKNTEVGCHALQGIFQLRDRTCVSDVSCIAGGFFTTGITWETPRHSTSYNIYVLNLWCKKM